MVAEVQPGSPAEAAGLRPGDELVRVGELAITNAMDIERGLLDVRPGRPASVTIRRGGTRECPGPGRPPRARQVAAPAGTTDDAGLAAPRASRRSRSRRSTCRRSPPSSAAACTSRPSLPGSPAAEAAIQKGDILVGMNVGSRHWETIRPDNILYVLRQPETVQTQSALFYVVRRNGIQPRRISLGSR